MRHKRMSATTDRLIIMMIRFTDEMRKHKSICCFLNKKNKKYEGQVYNKKLIVPKYPLLMNIINNRDTMHKVYSELCSHRPPQKRGIVFKISYHCIIMING